MLLVGTFKYQTPYFTYQSPNVNYSHCHMATKAMVVAAMHINAYNLSFHKNKICRI